MIYPVTDMYDVPLMVARGYASLSFLHSAAEYIGTLDVPAFKSITFPAITIRPASMPPRRSRRCCAKLAPDAEIHFERVAVTLPEQITQWDLPTRPTKASDSRSKGFGDISVELDAIPPDQLRELVRSRYRAASAETPVRNPEGRRSQRARNHHAAGQRHGRGERSMTAAAMPEPDLPLMAARAELVPPRPTQRSTGSTTSETTQSTFQPSAGLPA